MENELKGRNINVFPSPAKKLAGFGVYITDWKLAQHDDNKRIGNVSFKRTRIATSNVNWKKYSLFPQPYIERLKK
jgi:hypothetical protein